MLNKSLLVLLSSFFMSNRGSATESQNDVFLSLKRNIRQEMSALISKILLGTILVGMVLFSFVRFIESMKVFLGRYENGVVFEMAIFASVITAGLGLLYVVFKDSRKALLENIPLQHSHSPLEFNFQSIAEKFAEGFMDGMDTPPAPKNAKETSLQN